MALTTETAKICDGDDLRDGEKYNDHRSQKIYGKMMAFGSNTNLTRAILQCPAGRATNHDSVHRISRTPHQKERDSIQHED